MNDQTQAMHGHRVLRRPVRRGWWLERQDECEWQDWMDDYLVRWECADCGKETTGHAQVVEIAFMDSQCIRGRVRE